MRAETITRGGALFTSMIIAVVLALGPSMARAQQDEPHSVHSDLATFALSTRTVPTGRVVTEAGVATTVLDDRTTVTLPQALVRAGVHDLVELRLLAPSLIIDAPDEGDVSVSGNDIDLGFKIGGSIASWIQASIAPTLTFPLGGGAVGAPAVQGNTIGQVKLIPVSELELVVASAAGWVQRALPNQEVDARFRYQGGLIVNVIPIPTVTIFAQSHASHVDSERALAAAGGGVAWHVIPAVELSAWADFGLTDATPDAQVYATGAALF